MPIRPNLVFKVILFMDFNEVWFALSRIKKKKTIIRIIHGVQSFM